MPRVKGEAKDGEVIDGDFTTLSGDDARGEGADEGEEVERGTGREEEE